MSKRESNKFAMECYFCYKKMHMKKDSWKLKNKHQSNQEEKVDQLPSPKIRFSFFLKVMPLMWYTMTPIGWLIVELLLMLHHIDIFFTYTMDNYGSVEMGIDVWLRLSALVTCAWRLVLELGWCLSMLSMLRISR